MLQMPIQTFYDYKRDIFTAREQLFFPYYVWGRTIFKNVAGVHEVISEYKDREIAIQQCHSFNTFHADKVKAEIAANEAITKATTKVATGRHKPAPSKTQTKSQTKRPTLRRKPAQQMEQ